MARPTGVTILAVLAFVCAGLAALAGLASFFMGSVLSKMVESSGMGMLMTGAGALVGVIILILAGLYFLVGFGLWNLKNWGRILTVVFVALGLLGAALGLFKTLSPFQMGTFLWQLFWCALDVWIITYLFKPHVKQAFS